MSEHRSASSSRSPLPAAEPPCATDGDDPGGCQPQTHGGGRLTSLQPPPCQERTVHSRRGVLGCLQCQNKAPQPGELKQREYFFHHLGSYESKIKVWAQLSPPEACLLACRQPSSPCVLTWPSLCVCLCPNLLLMRTPVLLDQGPPLWPHFTLIISLKALSPKATLRR